MTKESKPRRFAIVPKVPWWKIDWQEHWQYRDLLMLLIRRDFVSRYKQTVIGPAWLLIQPLATTLTMAFTFGQVLKISTDKTPPILFYFAGFMGWNLFVSLFQSIGAVLQANLHVFSKVYFPRLIVPAAMIGSATIPFVVQLLLFFGLSVIIGGIPVGIDHGALLFRGMLFFSVFIQTVLLATGAGLILTSISAVYRDLQHAFGLVVSLLLYLTPVIYPLSNIPQSYRPLFMLNPMVFIVEGYKHALLGTGVMELPFAITSWGLTIVIAILGLMMFNSTERTFIDLA
jgi:lipopolysaccharide transport system permease protein